MIQRLKVNIIDSWERWKELTPTQKIITIPGLFFVLLVVLMVTPIVLVFASIQNAVEVLGLD